MSQITASPDRIVTLSSHLYSALLALYPPQFRREYGPHMAQVFRDCCRATARRGRVAGFAWLWLTTLIDLGVTAVSEWFAGTPGPGHYVQKIGIGLAAGMAGGVLAGLGARLSMRGVALAAGLPTGFTVGGTLAIVIFGLVLGLPFGPLFMALRRLLPGRGVGKGLFYGLLLVVVVMVPPILFYRGGEVSLISPLAGLALFAPLGPLYGGAVALTARRFERDLFPDEPRPAPAQAGAQVNRLMSILLFAGLLQLGVLGVGSITHYLPRLPATIVRLLPAIHVPFALVRDTNAALVNLIALGYFGVSSLLFWQRARLPMARLTAGLLLFIGGALFHTGAQYYYAALQMDVHLLQAFFHVLQVAGSTALVALFYLFPTGRLAARWLAWFGLGWAAWAGVWLFAPALPGNLAAFVLAGFLGAGWLAQRRRHRAATVEERAQLRWPLGGFAAVVIGLAGAAAVLMAVPDLALPRVPGLAGATTFAPFMLFWLPLPVSIAHAVWRRSLWAAPGAAAQVSPST